VRDRYLNKHEIKAFTAGVAQSTVGITGVDRAGNGESRLGTGTLFRYKDFHGILTAQHVIEGCTET
jgi:hypothetical protein